MIIIIIIIIKMSIMASKNLLLSSQVLAHYDSRYPLVLACDAIHGLVASC